MICHQILRKHAKLYYWFVWQCCSTLFHDGVWLRSHCLFPSTSAKSISTPGLPNKIQVNRVLQPWKQANIVDQKYLIPDPKSLATFCKSSMSYKHSQPSSELTMSQQRDTLAHFYLVNMKDIAGCAYMSGSTNSVGLIVRLQCPQPGNPVCILDAVKMPSSPKF